MTYIPKPDDIKLERDGFDALYKPRWREYWYLSDGWTWTPIWHSARSARSYLCDYERVEAWGDDPFSGIYTKKL